MIGIIYGRRTNGVLRKNQKELIKNLLPKLSPIHYDFQDKETWLEIGFGMGEHLTKQALKNLDKNIIGAEIFINGIANLLTNIEQHNLQNIRIWSQDARLLLNDMEPSSISKVFLLFPDPWQKKRHHKRRLINDKNLNSLARILKPGGSLIIASDFAEYVEWILKHLKNNDNFTATFDYQAPPTIAPNDWEITRYEQKV